jgi:TRAP-type uncharacterized transport system substrate-binding protein
VGAVWLALWYFIPAPPTSITMAAGVKGGGFGEVGDRYKELLSRHHVTLNLRYYEIGNDNVRLIDDPKSGVSAAFMFTGQTNGKESPDLVSLGRFANAPMWIFYRAAAPIDRLTQLKSKRINVSPGVAKLVDEILAAHGVNAGNATISMLLVPQAVKALRDGDLDAAFLPPVALNTPIIQSLLHDPSVRLMDVAQADALARRFPTLHRLVLPQGVVDLQNNIPAADVNLLASSNVVVVRKDLHPELIYLLAQTMKEVHGGADVFQDVDQFPSANDPEFPMAEEAVDYYKNGPSFLQRYLPFWMVNYAKRLAAVLVAALAITLPAFSFAPRLYSWFVHDQMRRLYRRLRIIDNALQVTVLPQQIPALHSELTDIDCAASGVSMRNSDLYFMLRYHLDRTRARLAEVSRAAGVS